MKTIHLLGDSLVKAYGDDKCNFIGGWGDHLQSFLDVSHIQVKDYAEGGRSTRSFLNEGRFFNNGILSMANDPNGLGPAYDSIAAGDYVFIEFAHNDDESKRKLTIIDRMVPLGTPDHSGEYPVILPEESMKTTTKEFPKNYISMMEEDGLSQDEIIGNKNKYLDILPKYGDSYFAYDSGATYKGFLKMYVDAVRAKKAVPVLITPVARITMQQDNVIEAVAGHHGGYDGVHLFPYVAAMKQLAEEEHVLLLNLFERSKEVFETLGLSDAKLLQSIKDPNGDTIGESRYNRPKNWVRDYDELMKSPDSFTFDDTHQNRIGSFIFAGKIIELILDETDGNDNFADIKNYIRITSSKQVEVPQKLKSRLTDIQNTFSKVKLF